jgi:hypothetical protein
MAEMKTHDEIARLLHDLNNDLAVISGYLALVMMSEGSLPPALGEKLQMIRKGAERMAGNVRKAQETIRKAREE